VIMLAAPSSDEEDAADDDDGGAVWIAERHVALADVAAPANSLRRGKRVLAVWKDGHSYSCEVLGSSGRRQVAVQFEDGMQYDAPADDLRALLDEPLFANFVSAESLQSGRLNSLNPAAWSNRNVAKNTWCSDSGQCGPLQRTLASLLASWRDNDTAAKAFSVEPGPTEGLLICRDFLDAAETEALRTLFAAHNNRWSMYNWGHVGRKSELASVLQRIDFGLPEMTAEGVAAARSMVQPIGELQQQIISLLEMRLRAAFGAPAWGGTMPNAPTNPNMMQFTEIAPGTCLGNHFDRRDKWAEGIASIAWSDAPGVSDPRGDPWALRMQIGPESNAIESIVTTLPAGSAYLMTGKSQGRSEVCQRHCVAHEFCTCCWTHGVWNEQSQQTRQSITLRVFDLEWGRSGLPSSGLPSSGLPSASADGGDAE